MKNYKIITNKTYDTNGKERVYIRITHSGFNSFEETCNGLTETKNDYEKEGYTTVSYMTTYAIATKESPTVINAYEIDFMKNIVDEGNLHNQEVNNDE